MKAIIFAFCTMLAAYAACAQAPVKINPLHPVVQGDETLWVGDSDSLTELKRQYNFVYDRGSLLTQLYEKSIGGNMEKVVVIEELNDRVLKADDVSASRRQYRRSSNRYWGKENIDEVKSLEYRAIEAGPRYNKAVTMYNQNLKLLVRMSGGIDFTNETQLPSWAPYPLPKEFEKR